MSDGSSKLVRDLGLGEEISKRDATYQKANQQIQNARCTNYFVPSLSFEISEFTLTTSLLRQTILPLLMYLCPVEFNRTLPQNRHDRGLFRTVPFA